MADVRDAVLQNPPLRVSEIQQRAVHRNGADSLLLQGSLSARVRMVPPALGPSASLLWGEFQQGISQRHDNPPAPANASLELPLALVRKPARKKAAAQSKAAARLADADDDDDDVAPTDWPTRVARKLFEAMQASHARVKTIFREFDTDGSGAVDCSELYSALQALGILDALGVPEAEQGPVVLQVFDTFDIDGDGVLEFSELQKQLRAGKHDERAKLAKQLQPGGAGKVEVVVTQTHHVRKKEEWKALERFDELLDADGDGAVTTQEALSLLLSEGYDAKFVTQLMKTLDADGNGVVDREEWRKGVLKLPPSLLLALTDPVAPPSGEAFVDVATPLLVERAPTYHRSRGSSASVAAVDEAVKTGASASGCTILDTTERAVRLPQLRALLAHIARRCPQEKWVDTSESVLDPNRVNLYDAMAYVIKPATRAKRCSYVELVADGPQPPSWFVSHWWGSPLTELGACLEQHARDRACDLNTPGYWVCAFALNQWNADELKQPVGTLSRAFSAASDGVVSVVDKQGGCFGRTWYAYEALLAVRERNVRDKFPWDVYTHHVHRLQGELTVHSQGKCAFTAGLARDAERPEHALGGGAGTRDLSTVRPQHDPAGPTVVVVGHDRSAVGVTDGLTDDDAGLPRCQVAREAHFPSKLLVQALKVSLEHSATTVALDHRRLLNTLCGVEEANVDDADAPAGHSAYAAADSELRGCLGVRAVLRAVLDGHKLHRELLPVLGAALHLQSIELPPETHFPGCAVHRERYEEVLDALPRSLRKLRAPLPRGLRVLQVGTLGKLDGLEHLDLGGSSSLDSLPEDVAELSKLSYLNLSGCSKLEAVNTRIYDLPMLKTLILHGCSSLKNVSAVGLTPSALETLVLDGCTGLAELPETAGPKLETLTTLTLSGCTGLTELPRWVLRLEKKDKAVIRPETLL